MNKSALITSVTGQQFQRLCYVDLAKAVMILLVVVGHICQCYLSEGKNEPLFRFIYSFHMPLFFLLSGFCLGLTQQRLKSQTFWMWLKKKIRTLLVPFFIWGLIIYPYIDPAKHIPLDLNALFQLVEKPDIGPWFLISLFCTQTACYPVFRFDNYWGWLVPIAFLICGTILRVPFLYCNPYYYFSLLIGFLLFKFSAFILQVNVATSALILFIFAEMFHPNPLLCTVLAGVVLVYICKQTLGRSGGGISWVLNQMVIIGRNTMAIYLIHYLIIWPIHKQAIDVSSYRVTPIFIITFIIAFIVAVICTYIAKTISFFPLLNFLLLGKKTKV